MRGLKPSQRLQVFYESINTTRVFHRVHYMLAFWDSHLPELSRELLELRTPNICDLLPVKYRTTRGNIVDWAAP